MNKHVVCKEDNRWPKRIMTWSPGGRRRRGRPEVKWEKEVERVMKQKNLTRDDAINWLKATENQ
jgi:V8-like Glu-specific endopeptidase